MARVPTLLALATLCLLFIHSVQGQETCPAVVEESLTTLDQYCEAMDRNSACYGSHQVRASFREATNFDEPSDRAPLHLLETIQTLPYDPVTQSPGIALLNVQANIPDTMPGQGVIFILIGDTVVENDTAADALPDLSQSLTITTAVGANLRSDHNPNATVIGSVPAGTTLEADIRTPNGKWLRVVYEQTTAWLHRSVLTTTDGIDALPAPQSTAMSPMQAFRFRTGVGEADCQQAESALLIQGPNNLHVELVANGATIRIGSTILLDYQNAGTLRLSVLSGAAYVDGVSIPAGFMARAAVDAEGVVTEAFGRVKRIPAQRLEALGIYAALPETLMHYIIDLPSADETRAIEQAMQPSAPAQPSVGADREPSSRGRDRRDDYSQRGRGKGRDDDDDDD